MCKNEYVIPLGPELKELYEDPDVGHSLRVLQVESVQPQMNMSDITYVFFSHKCIFFNVMIYYFEV